MAERTLLDSGSPVTQSIEAVAALLTWRKMPTDPMPNYVELPGKVFLVLSSKRDVYYTTLQRACSCPAQAWHPDERCKHQKKFFGGESEAPKHKRTTKAQSMAKVLTEHNENLGSLPQSYQRMVKAAREDAKAAPLELMNTVGFRPCLE